MTIVREWDEKQDGPVPPVKFAKRGFKPTKAVLITDDAGDWYGLSDGKTDLPLSLVRSSAKQSAADEATRVEAAVLTKTLSDAKVYAQEFKARLDGHEFFDDAAWAKLDDRAALDTFRKIFIGSLGMQIAKPELVAQAVDALPAKVKVDEAAGLSPAAEVKP